MNSILFAVIVANGSVIPKKALKCEKIDKEDCAKRGDKECASSIVECEELDPDKPMHCFVVWNHDNVTGMILFAEQQQL